MIKDNLEGNVKFSNICGLHNIPKIVINYKLNLE